MNPKARQDRLLLQEAGDELVVYDQDRHRAHRLNRTAALVWRHCDGKTTVTEIANLLQRELSVPADEEAVWLALDRLDRAHLLRERLTLPASAARTSRRALVRKLAMAGGLALVTSIVAPEAAQAATCFAFGQCNNGRIGKKCTKNGSPAGACDGLCTGTNACA